MENKLLFKSSIKGSLVGSIVLLLIIVAQFVWISTIFASFSATSIFVVAIICSIIVAIPFWHIKNSIFKIIYTNNGLEIHTIGIFKNKIKGIPKYFIGIGKIKIGSHTLRVSHLVSENIEELFSCLKYLDANSIIVKEKHFFSKRRKMVLRRKLDASLGVNVYVPAVIIIFAIVVYLPFNSDLADYNLYVLFFTSVGIAIFLYWVVYAIVMRKRIVKIVRKFR